jgi:hypothetical protein
LPFEERRTAAAVGSASEENQRQLTLFLPALFQREVDLLGRRLRDNFPIECAVYHLPHSIEPPFGPLPPMACGKMAGLSLDSEGDFKLVFHILRQVSHEGWDIRRHRPNLFLAAKSQGSGLSECD